MPHLPDETTIIGEQARELLQSPSIVFPQTPFGDPGHDIHILFAEDGFTADIADTEFAPGTGGGSGRGMNELGRLFFKTAYDEDTELVGVIGLRRALMDICTGAGGGQSNWAF